MADSDVRIELRRMYNATRERVYAAWTEPAALKRWFGPDGHELTSIEVDVRVGGAYRLAVTSDEGQTHYLVGTYEVVQPPERLVYTWRVEEGASVSDDTLVTVEFVAHGEQTEVILTQETFEDKVVREMHEIGWQAGLKRLEQKIGDW